MKAKLLTIFILAISAVCYIFLIPGRESERYPKYEYAIVEIVPDSLKANEAEFIKETMRASDQHLTTSDYEDPEDVLEAAHYTFERINRVPVEGLNVIVQEHTFGVFIPHYKLEGYQKKVFLKLKAGIILDSKHIQKR